MSQAVNIRSSLSPDMFDCCAYTETWRNNIPNNALWCASNITFSDPEIADGDVHPIGPGKCDTHGDSCRLAYYPGDDETNESGSVSLAQQETVMASKQ